MLSQQQTAKNIDLWQSLVTRELAYIQSRQEFLSVCTDRVTTIQKGLQNPRERGTALRLLFYLPLPERQSLLAELVELASVGHSDIELCREAILSLPKSWLLANIENSAEGLLGDGTDEEYRRLLELYIKIDDRLTEKLVKRALQDEDADIREAGEDFQRYLKNC
ncbi:MAG: hypothetical protein SXA11_02300 [Cyanobacteriota bacterium]|nr:hypothetical protein [Cyanobacteriota bacterium]